MELLMLQLPKKSSTQGRRPSPSSSLQSTSLTHSTCPLAAWVSSIKQSIDSSDHTLPGADSPARQQGTAWCGKSENWSGSLKTEESSLQSQSPKSTKRSSARLSSTATTLALKKPMSSPNWTATIKPTLTSSTPIAKHFWLSTSAKKSVNLLFIRLS